MGLKTTNYQIEKLGITLPEVYAIIDKIKNEKNSVSVEFGIYTSRENALKFQPIDTKRLHFVWDRKTDMAVQAYTLAKCDRGLLSGWEDDIIDK